jgi:transcriptional regulator
VQFNFGGNRGPVGGGSTAGVARFDSTKHHANQVIGRGATEIVVSLQNENTAALRLSMPKTNEIIRKTMNDEVVFDLSGFGDVNVITIPKAAFKRFADAGFSVELLFPHGSVAFYNETVVSISKRVWNKNITVELDHDGEVVIRSGRRIIRDY